MKTAMFGILGIILCAQLALAGTVTIRPDGQGAYSAWANTGCTAGSTEWQCVDENPAVTTDYLSTSTKSAKESFTFSSTGLSGETINSVTLYYYAKYSSSTRNKMQPLIRSGSDYLGNVMTLTSTYALYSQTYTTNPATGSAWTVANVEALEAGMNAYTSSQGGVVAQVYAVVDYTVANTCADTDGGNTTNVTGTTSGLFNGTNYTHTDSCASSSTVLEYFCNGNLEQSANIACGAGTVCSGGRCVVADSCSDTDGGNNIWTIGTASGYLSQTPYSYSDSCVDSGNVLENYCAGAYRTTQAQSCGTDGFGFYYCGNTTNALYGGYYDYFCASGGCGYTFTQPMVQNCSETNQTCVGNTCV